VLSVGTVSIDDTFNTIAETDLQKAELIGIPIALVIMVTVFAGFAAGRLVMFQQMGFGLAVAVLLDATVVRSVLVPASMALLGDRNWYLSSWLGWMPRLNIEGAADRTEQPVGSAAD
jgi:uncharacterized membrane protein YdfJ with MMPL/SSD domain